MSFFPVLRQAAIDPNICKSVNYWWLNYEELFPEYQWYPLNKHKEFGLSKPTNLTESQNSKPICIYSSCPFTVEEGTILNFVTWGVINWIWKMFYFFEIVCFGWLYRVFTIDCACLNSTNKGPVLRWYGLFEVWYPFWHLHHLPGIKHRISCLKDPSLGAPTPDWKE